MSEILSNDSFLKHYIICALWSTNDNSDERGGEPLDSNYDISDLSQECLAQMADDCARFQIHAEELLEHYYETKKSDGTGFYTLKEAGHDFWLTRNGHGAGFFDRKEINSYVRDALTELCDDYDEIDLEIGENKKIHIL